MGAFEKAFWRHIFQASLEDLNWASSACALCSVCGGTCDGLRLTNTARSKSSSIPSDCTTIEFFSFFQWRQNNYFKFYFIIYVDNGLLWFCERGCIPPHIGQYCAEPIRPFLVFLALSEHHDYHDPPIIPLAAAT
jgi:hypothetical protein